MTREDALKLADKIIEDLLSSGEEALFHAARKADGTVDQAKLVAAALRARERIADNIMNDEPKK